MAQISNKYDILDKLGNSLATIIRSEYLTGQTTFFSKNEYSQQLGIIKYPQGGIIKPHYHNELSREVIITQEVLIIRRGRVRVNLFDKELNFIESVELRPNDVIFLISGGHGFEMLEDTDMLEVKQGPYNGRAQDKTQFEWKRNDTSK